jgi:hypothetical protein
MKKKEQENNRKKKLWFFEIRGTKLTSSGTIISIKEQKIVISSNNRNKIFLPKGTNRYTSQNTIEHHNEKEMKEQTIFKIKRKKSVWTNWYTLGNKHEHHKENQVITLTKTHHNYA